MKRCHELMIGWHGSKSNYYSRNYFMKWQNDPDTCARVSAWVEVCERQCNRQNGDRQSISICSPTFYSFLLNNHGRVSIRSLQKHFFFCLNVFPIYEDMSGSSKFR